MSTAQTAQTFLPETAPTAELSGSAHALSAFIRLVACPRCAGGRRTLSERDGMIIGRCLRCSEEFTAPLATVAVAPPVLVGRGGQRIIPLSRSD